MCGLEKLEAAEFHERDIAPRQFDFERRAMMRGAEQHGLLLERDSGLAMLQDPVGHVARLVGLVAHRYELRPLGGEAVRPQFLLVTLSGQINDRIRGREDRLRGAVVAVKRDDVRRRREKARKIENVARRRGAK